MAITAYWMGKAILNAFGGETEGESVSIDYLTDDIRVLLCTTTFTPDQDTMEFYSDITNEVADGSGYTTKGELLATKTLGYTALTKVTKFDADNVVWSASTITAYYAVVYKDTGSAATSPLLGYIDFGQNYSSSSGDFTINWDSDGIFTSTVE